jgi:hypothetical protein
MKEGFAFVLRPGIEQRLSSKINGKDAGKILFKEEYA